jgi:RNA polymerase sigma factor (sigma-70 family)
MDIRHDVYELAISAARKGLPSATRPYLFAIARNHLINRATRARIVSFELVADLELIDRDLDAFDPERHLSAREALRRVQEGLAKLTPRVRQIVQLRKIEGLNIKETAERLGIGSDAVRQPEPVEPTADRTVSLERDQRLADLGGSSQSHDRTGPAPPAVFRSPLAGSSIRADGSQRRPREITHRPEQPGIARPYPKGP